MNLQLFHDYLDHPENLEFHKGEPAPGSRLKKYLKNCRRQKHLPKIKIYDTYPPTNMLLHGHKPDDLVEAIWSKADRLTDSQHEGITEYKALEKLGHLYPEDLDLLRRYYDTFDEIFFWGALKICAL
jgi:hypothetical protein